MIDFIPFFDHFWKNLPLPSSKYAHYKWYVPERKIRNLKMYGKSIDWLGQKFLEIGNFVLEIVEIENTSSFTAPKAEI